MELSVNYRSHSDIVRFYDRWMTTTAADWSNPDPGGRDPFRYPKTHNRPHDPAGDCDYPAVIAVAGRDVRDEGRQLADLLLLLRHRGVITRL